MKMFTFMFGEFGLYLVTKRVFLMGFEQGSIVIKVTLRLVSMINMRRRCRCHCGHPGQDHKGLR